jgi:hypothetical protein
VTVFPCGSPQPNASNLNFSANQTIANLVFARIGTAQKICFFTSAPTQLIVDLSAVYNTPASLISLVPARLIDTRPAATVDGILAGAGRRTAGSITAIPVASRGNVSASATAVALNVTMVSPGAGGYVTVFPCGSVQPNASNVNFNAGQTIPNAVVANLARQEKYASLLLRQSTSSSMLPENSQLPRLPHSHRLDLPIPAPRTARLTVRSLAKVFVPLDRRMK